MEKEPMRLAASAPFAPALAPFQRWLLLRQRWRTAMRRRHQLTWRKGKNNGLRWFELQEPYQELVQRWAEARAEDPSVSSKFSPSKVAREMDVEREGMQPKPSFVQFVKTVVMPTRRERRQAGQAIQE